MGEISNVFNNYKDIEQAVVLVEESGVVETAADKGADEIENIIKILENNNAVKQVETLIAQIAAMDKEEKKYLLQQMQQ
jgi:arginine decarboxylase-like protein